MSIRMGVLDDEDVLQFGGAMKKCKCGRELILIDGYYKDDGTHDMQGYYICSDVFCNARYSIEEVEK